MEELKKRVLQILAISKLRSRTLETQSEAKTEEPQEPHIKENETENNNQQTSTAPSANTSNPAKILCLHGPPGTGKTSVAKAIAESFGRNFARISLGGDSDVSLIKGHHRGYVSAQPGKIIKAMIQAGSMNPVILLDEVDKIAGMGYQGGLYDVLLEVLDPVQNFQFKDHFMEEAVDLSQVLFICSANVVNSSKMGQAFVDRMELIEVSGYTLEEKQVIFKDHIFPKNLIETGLVRDRNRDEPKIEQDTQAQDSKKDTKDAEISTQSDQTPDLLGKIIEQNESQVQAPSEQILQKANTEIDITVDLETEHIENEHILRQFEGYVVKVEFTNNAILSMVNDYSREPGVRGLKKLSRKIMDKIAQHVAVTIVEGRPATDLEFDLTRKETGVLYSNGAKEVVYIITTKQVQEILGDHSFRRDSLYPGIIGKKENDAELQKEEEKEVEEDTLEEDNRDELIGVSMMPMSYFYGGSIDFVEVVELPQEPIKQKDDTPNPKSMPMYIDTQIENIIYSDPISNETTHTKHDNDSSLEPPKIQITGSAGKILQETVSASLSFARHFLYRSFQSRFLESTPLHVHFPAGATSINCPSAGLAIVSSFLSLALKSPLREGVGLAGEVSLNGKVSKVYGLKERLLAMKREQILEIVLSEENRGEVQDFKENITEGIKFHYVKDYQEAFGLLFDLK